MESKTKYEFEEFLIKPFDLNRMGESPLIVLIGGFQESQQTFLQMYYERTKLPLDFYTGGNTDQDTFLQNLTTSPPKISKQEEEGEKETEGKKGWSKLKQYDLSHYQGRKMNTQNIFVTSSLLALNYSYSESENYISFRKLIDNYYLLKTTLIILVTLTFNQNPDNIAMPLWINPNIDYIFIGLEKNLDSHVLKTIYNHYVGLFGSFSKFVNIYRYLTRIMKGNGYLVIDRNNYSNRFEHHVKYLDLARIDLARN